MLDQARFVLKMAKGHDDPWLQGEFAFWIWRAGGTMETQERIAAPFALQISGDWRAAAKAWNEIGCPYEEAMALAEGRLRFLRDSEQARQPKDYGTRCAQQACAAFRAARDRARKKTRSGSQVGKWKCLP